MIHLLGRAGCQPESMGSNSGPPVSLFSAAAKAADADSPHAGALESARLRFLRPDLVGIDELWAHRADTTRALGTRQSDAAIALCHNPDGLDVLPWGDFRGWVLAGHTHGGQCKPPFLPPPLLPVRNRRYTAGEIVVNRDRSLYISRGVGYLIRARFDVRPEITLFTLRRSASLT